MKIVSVALLENHLSQCGDSSRSAWVVRQLSKALEAGARPLPVPSARLKTIKVSMPEGLEARLRSIASAEGMPLSMLVAGLVASSLADAQAPAPPRQQTSIDDSLVSRLRDILQAPYRAAISALGAGKIVLLEAPTGSGKGRLIAATALHFAKAGRRVIVAAPLGVSHQLLKELDDIEPGSGYLVLGRPNFIDDDAIREILEETPDESVKAWVDSGGKPITPGTQALAQYLGIDLAWLAEDLASIRPDLVSSRSLLDEDSMGEAASLYAQLRDLARAQDRKVVIASHMMLAVHERLLQAQSAQETEIGIDLGEESISHGILGNRDLLIVDEAHLLEQAFSAVHSTSVHVQAMRRHARAVAPSLEPLIEALQEAIQAELESRNTDSLLAKESLYRVEDRIRAILDAAAREPRLTRKRLNNGMKREQKVLSKAIASLRLAIQAHSMYLELTPRRKHAVIHIGRASVASLLRRCLERSPTLLTSATIYNGTSTGYSADYLLMTLGLSSDKTRCHTLPPVEAPWLKNSCEVIVDTTLPRPPQKDEVPDAWHAALAGKLATIYDTAKGGVLVLCTSYDTASEVARLITPSTGQDAVIVQTPSRSAKACREAYISLYAQGIRPIWLGVGAAWTGIDLSDSSVPAEDDWLLTDLVICRIPFRVTRTLTHLWRCEKFPSAEYLEAMRVFRQGIGRLIRRPGPRHRRLWVLDARMADPACKAFVSVLARTFGGITKVAAPA